MIVQPDFLDHWKTTLLSDLLDDPCAPLYVLRLWAHCQHRKTSRFNRSADGMLKAICKAPQDAGVFEEAMASAGFIEVKDGEIIAHEWDEVNRYLINCWENGRKGGRPKNDNPEKTCGLSIGTPDKTQTEPIREDKIRLDREDTTSCCPEPKIDSTPEAEIILIFPCTGKVKKWKLTRAKLDEWRDTFDTLDVEAHCKRALQWLKDNPLKRKTARGMPRFLGNWLSREADKPKKGTAPTDSNSEIVGIG